MTRSEATPLTIAYTATSAEPGVNIAALTDALTHHANSALFPGDGEVTLVVQGRAPVTFDLTPMRGDQIEADMHKKAEQINDQLNHMLAEVAAHSEILEASTNGLDVLGVYDQAIAATPQGGEIVMVTSGLSTTDPVDLDAAGDWQLNPSGFVAQINPRDIPDAQGRSITWTGLGQTSTSHAAGTTDPTSTRARPNSQQANKKLHTQHAPGPAARQALHDLWLNLCETSGASSCTIDDSLLPATPTTATNRVPVIEFDQVTTNCLGTFTLAADIAFSPNSADLTQAADKLLAPIADALATCPDGRRINAYGHTAEVPGSGDGIGLSTARATNVLARLQQLGAPRNTIGIPTGYGDTRPTVDNTPNGAYREDLARLNRTVELTITN
ncbi:OmpA family protein [Nocardioides sp. 31GB23]|uniref:OmpA/MotB family protein n=1 Tax=Nocardioides sp. 31GB23 TaxID=3156065 RepID=UPI0032AFCD77